MNKISFAAALTTVSLSLASFAFAQNVQDKDNPQNPNAPGATDPANPSGQGATANDPAKSGAQQRSGADKRSADDKSQHDGTSPEARQTGAGASVTGEGQTGQPKRSQTETAKEGKQHQNVQTDPPTATGQGQTGQPAQSKTETAK